MKTLKDIRSGLLSEERDETQEKVEMAETQLHFICYAAKEIIEYIQMGGEIEEWYQNKLSKVHSDVESLHSYVEGEKRRTGMVAEEVEQLDEIGNTPDGKEKLAQYTKAAAEDLHSLGYEKGFEDGDDGRFVAKWKRLSTARQTANRKTGIKRAVDRLAKEEVEQVDEEYENNQKQHDYTDYKKWANHATKTGHRLKDQVVQERGVKARHTKAIVDGKDSSGKPTTAWMGHWNGHTGRGYIITVSDKQRKAIGEEVEQNTTKDKNNPVHIEYWQHDTMESGRWVRTKPMPRDTAERIVHHFHRGDIVDAEKVEEGRKLMSLKPPSAAKRLRDFTKPVSQIPAPKGGHSLSDDEERVWDPRLVGYVVRKKK